MIFPYSPIQKFAEQIYIVEGSVPRMPIGRRMTLIQTNDGGLLVHGVIELKEDDLKKMAELGRIQHMIVPNPHHTMDARWFSIRFPSSSVWVPGKSAAKFAKNFRISGDWNSKWPLSSEIQSIPLEGLRWDEAVLFHPKSKTLVITDLAFNFGTELQGLAKWIAKMNHGYDRFGMTRFFKLAGMKNPRAFSASLQTIAKLDFDKIVLSHGNCISTGAKDIFIKGFKDWLGANAWP